MDNTKNELFIITGDPGVGKTTLIKKLSSVVGEKGVETSGFYTEEVRKNGIREGFDVVTLNGERGRLARQRTLLSGTVRFKVGKYGVLVQEFENIALSSLKKPENASQHLLVIDEIGKMELFSEAFKSRIRDIFSQASNLVVLATIPVRTSDLLIESIRNNSTSRMWTITRSNRNSIHVEILNALLTTLNSKPQWPDLPGIALLRFLQNGATTIMFLVVRDKDSPKRTK